MSRLALTPTNVPVSATDISNPAIRTGDMYYNPTQGLKIYNGSSWESVATSTTVFEVDGGAFDSIAPYAGGYQPDQAATQTLNGGTP